MIRIDQVDCALWRRTVKWFFLWIVMGRPRPSTFPNILVYYASPFTNLITGLYNVVISFHLATCSLLEGIHQWPMDSPHKRASNAENVFIWWRHHVMVYWLFVSTSERNDIFVLFGIKGVLTLTISVSPLYSRYLVNSGNVWKCKFRLGQARFIKIKKYRRSSMAYMSNVIFAVSYCLKPIEIDGLISFCYSTSVL